MLEELLVIVHSWEIIIVYYVNIGSILAGVVSDQLKARALTCVTMLLLAVPSVSVLFHVLIIHLSLSLCVVVCVGSLC